MHEQGFLFIIGLLEFRHLIQKPNLAQNKGLKAMLTELDRFTKAPGEPHFILISKDMRKLSWTAVSAHRSDFWNTYLIPCYCYHFMLYCNDHNHCACPLMLCCLHDQPHPPCSFCRVCGKTATTKPFGPQTWAPAWPLHSVSFRLAQ